MGDAPVHSVPVTCAVLQGARPGGGFCEVVDQAGCGVVIASRDGTILSVNSRFAGLHDRTREECIGRNLSLFQSGGHHEQVRALLDSAARGVRYSCVEVWHVRKNGQPFRALMNFSPLLGRRGAPELVVVTAVEITDLQSSLRDYEERLSLAEEAANIGHYRIDVDAGTAEWSDQTFRIFGLSPSDGAPTVESYASMVHPDDRATVYAHFDRCISEKKRFDLTYRILRADGRVRIVRSIGTLRTGRTGSSVMSGTFQDVTEPHESLEALRTSERRMRSLVESSDDHVFMLDPDGTFIASNDRVQHYGLTSGSELLGRAMAELYPPQTASLHSRYLGQVRESGAAVAFEHTLHGKNGITFHRHILNPIMENGRLLAIGGICRDITDQKRLERDLQESRALLVDRNRELERKNVALQELIQHLRDPASPNAPPAPESRVHEGTPIPRELSILTPRELQVCLQLRKGMSSKEVAHLLGIAPRSVETHRNHIRRKLRLDGANLSAYLQMLLGRPSD